MGKPNVIGFLLVAWTVFSFAHSMPYPYYQHEQCTVTQLNMSELVGDWHMIYHKDNLNKKVVLKMSMLDDKTLLTSFNEGDQEVNSFNLTQNNNLAGKLENLVNQGTWTMAVPTFVLSVQPDKYMTLYNSKFNATDDWAIYSRTTDLSEDSEDYNKAIQGLTCMNLAKDGKAPIHKL